MLRCKSYRGEEFHAIWLLDDVSVLGESIVSVVKFIASRAIGGIIDNSLSCGEGSGE